MTPREALEGWKTSFCWELDIYEFVCVCQPLTLKPQHLQSECRNIHDLVSQLVLSPMVQWWHHGIHPAEVPSRQPKLWRISTMGRTCLWWFLPTGVAFQEVLVTCITRSWSLELWLWMHWCLISMCNIKQLCRNVRYIEYARISRVTWRVTWGNLKLPRLMRVVFEQKRVKFATVWGGIQASHLHLHPKTWWVARRCLGRHWSCHQSWQDGDGGAHGGMDNGTLEQSQRFWVLICLGNHWLILVERDGYRDEVYLKMNAHIF